MITLAILACVLAPLRDGQPPSPKPFRLLPGPDVDEFIRVSRDRNQKMIAFLEAEIAWTEKLVAENPSAFPPKEASRVREDIEDFRRRIAYYKAYRQELESWQQQRKTNPLPENDWAALDRLKQLQRERPEWLKARPTAPMPREVKR